MDIITRKEQIQQLIAADNILEAVRRSMDYVKDFGTHEGDLRQMIALSSDFTAIGHMHKRGQISSEEAIQRRTALLLALLGLLDAVEANFSIHPPTPTP